ncbi:MAG: hypothetical protein ACE5DL_02875 [Nitrosopumilaceae archaeon]
MNKAYRISKNHLNQIIVLKIHYMGIRSCSDYVQFFINLQMGPSVSFLNFLNNEKLTLKSKLKNKEIQKEKLLEGLEIVESLILEIQSNGEDKVLEKYSELN